MKFNLILIAVSLFSFSIFAQNVDVPKKVQDEFMKLYPKITEVKWSKESKDEFEAEFKEAGKSVSVVLNSEGELKETETKIEIKELPSSVEPFVMKNYKDYKITEAAKIIDPKGVLTYEAEISKGIEKKDLLFDNDGTSIVKKMEKSESEEKEDEDTD
ncbi:MAG: hypothetical protein OQJ93_08245 [Ignavibacteriaceae bacterium]|jgi:hypothetical protein|nr:hypothetical protein [Ignavibacteriaceae bacterium]MCW8994953.1 hypothetical protein [Psychromonas sp.]MCW9097365.1 hypothetical protein [Ignavibacteriaceae bacterium]